MANLTREQILANAAAIIKNLEKLRLEQQRLLVSEQEAQDANDKLDIISRNIELIEVGLAEGNVMFSIVQFMKGVEAETHGLKDLAKKLDAENTWLTDELTDARKKLLSSEQSVAQLEEEKRELEFKNELLETELARLKSNDFDEKQFLDKSSETAAAAPGDQKSIILHPELQLVREASAGCILSMEYHRVCKLISHYVRQGMYEVAVPLCKQAIDKLEKTTGHYHPEVAILLNILALIYRDQKMYLQSENLLKDALDIREKTLGPGHPAVASTLNNMSVLYEKIGQHDHAENFSKKSLKLCEQRLGKDHPDVVRHLKTLGILYQKHNKYEDAAECFQRCLGICHTKPELGEAKVAEFKVNLANCYFKLKKFHEAEILYKQVLVRAYEQKESEEKSTRSLSRSAKVDFAVINAAQKKLNEIQQQFTRQRGRYGTMHSVSPRKPLSTIKIDEISEKRRYSISSPNKTGYEQICRDRAGMVKPTSILTLNKNTLAASKQTADKAEVAKTSPVITPNDTTASGSEQTGLTDRSHSRLTTTPNEKTPQIRTPQVEKAKTSSVSEQICDDRIRPSETRSAVSSDEVPSEQIETAETSSMSTLVDVDELTPSTSKQTWRDQAKTARASSAVTSNDVSFESVQASSTINEERALLSDKKVRKPTLKKKICHLLGFDKH